MSSLGPKLIIVPHTHALVTLGVEIKGFSVTLPLAPLSIVHSSIGPNKLANAMLLHHLELPVIHMITIGAVVHHVTDTREQPIRKLAYIFPATVFTLMSMPVRLVVGPLPHILHLVRSQHSEPHARTIDQLTDVDRSVVVDNVLQTLCGDSQHLYSRIVCSIPALTITCPHNILSKTRASICRRNRMLEEVTFQKV